MTRLKTHILIATGWILVAAGLLILPLPWPGSVLMIGAGAFMLVRNSAGARRLYVRTKRRWPGAIGALDRRMRRKRVAAGV